MLNIWNDPAPNSLLVELTQDWQEHRRATRRLIESSTAKFPEATHEVIRSTGAEKAAKWALARAVHAFTSSCGGGAWNGTNWTFGEHLADEFLARYREHRAAELARPALVEAWNARVWPTDGTCLDTGLRRGECECADYNPANPYARHPNQQWFDEYVSHHLVLA